MSKFKEFRNVENVKEYQDLVAEFIKNREGLKKVIKQEQGIQRELTESSTAKFRPVVDAIEKLNRTVVSASNNADSTDYLQMFRRANTTMKPTAFELKVGFEKGQARLGKDGLVEINNLQDGEIFIRNSKTGENALIELTPELAELLLIPKIPKGKEYDDATISTYKYIMEIAGKPKGSQS